MSGRRCSSCAPHAPCSLPCGDPRSPGRFCACGRSAGPAPPGRLELDRDCEFRALEERASMARSRLSPRDSCAAVAHASDAIETRGDQEPPPLSVCGAAYLAFLIWNFSLTCFAARIFATPSELPAAVSWPGGRPRTIQSASSRHRFHRWHLRPGFAPRRRHPLSLLFLRLFVRVPTPHIASLCET